jgi:thiamine-phosphate pyrophosphorylase
VTVSREDHDQEMTVETGEDGQGGGAGIWRALDASANRAGEALRVLEDVVRFALDDAPLTGILKQLRHDLAALLAAGPLRHRTALRDVAGDVGAGLTASSSLPRRSVADLVAANAARAAQALRSLEEAAAVVAPGAAGGFERLRYRVYDVERRGLAAARSRERLAAATVCVLVDGRADEVAFARLVEAVIGAGVRMLQLRDKSLPLAALAARGRTALAIARRHAPGDPALVIVNDRVDVAVAIGAAGAHVGAEDLPVNLARRVLGPDAVIGATAHDLVEARAAVAAGADYLGIGPCFPSTTKHFGTVAPREFLRAVSGETSLPVYAIGGITLERLDELADLGIRRVAVAAAVTEATDPASAAAGFIARLAALADRAG